MADDYASQNPLLPPGIVSPRYALPLGQNPLGIIGSRQVKALTDAQDPIAQMVLGKIAGGESPDYQTIYGGSKFSGYTDHPRQRQVITEGPHKGEFSDAAGRYQFLSSTWDSQRRKLGLTDFTPESQDAGAWDLARTTYQHATGRDLHADALAGKINWQALQGQWPSLGKAPGQGRYGKGALTQEGTHTGQDEAQAPPSPQMALAMMAALAPQHSFAPVDYDPFKLEPKVPGTV